MKRGLIMNIYKVSIVFLILLLGVGFVSASDDVGDFNGADYLSSDGASIDEDVLGTDSLGSDGSSVDEDLSSADSLSAEEDVLGADDDANPSLDDEESVDDDVNPGVYDEGPEGYDYDSAYIDYWIEYYSNLLNGSSQSGLICGDASEIVTSDVTLYDFNDAYRVKVLDDEGRPVFKGKVDFYVNHELAGTSFLDYKGIASFYLDSCINASGSYDIVSIYSDLDDSNSIMTHQRVDVDNVLMSERDIRIINEGIKLYDLGEYYSVKVVDKEGNPVTDGYVVFIVYDRVYYANISDEGIASCFLPLDLNFTGNLLVWSIYSDGNLYDLSLCEQISIGTRTMVSLDKTSLGSRMVTRWNGRDFVYGDGKYVAYLGDNGYLVIELSGNTYLLQELNISTESDFNLKLHSLAEYINTYDVVVLNLANRTYDMDIYNPCFSDQEWDYASRFAYGQLIVNGNGATILGSRDLNFMYIGSDANVNFFNVNITNFDHCFINHGSLMCKECVFYDNVVYKTDVKLWGSGTVVHNYNTVFFDDCLFIDNDATFNAITTDHMGASILYAEPYSLNIFNGLYGTMYADSFYCDEYSTTIIYNSNYEGVSNLLKDSEVMTNAYFTVVDDSVFYTGEPWVVNVSTSEELGSVFWVLNSYINATEVVINLAPGDYYFDTDDYSDLRYYNWRSNAYNAIKDRYLLDVGFCPVTINGNGAVIRVGGNDDNDDYHFAFVGKYGSLTLNDVELRNFNTALYVTGGVFANHSVFRDNVIDHNYYDGDDGGVFRAFGGSVICHDCSFIGNGGDDDTDDFYAELSSYVEFRNCSSPEGRMKDSYLKCTLVDKKNVNLKGDSIFERAFEDGFEDVDFVVFNVSDDASYNAVFDYLTNHTVSCLYINFTGDYVFNLSDVFERKMSVVFMNNGFDVSFDEMKIEKSSTLSFINFNFDDVKIVNKGSVSFINCSFFNRDGDDYFIKNEGSCSLVNCSFFDNDCDDAIIHNEGSLTIYDSFFTNNDFDDYGVIYNDGGSVTCVNTKFSGNGGYYVYNFATGDCGFASTSHQVTIVEFDHPWSNFKTGLIKGAFLLGTAFISYGVGYGIGVMAPAVTGMIASSVAGAGIGLAAGVTYGMLEGQAYHDYSNMWSNVLSFTLLGFSMGQTGFGVGSTDVVRINQEINENLVVDGQGAGGAGGQNPQAPQNPGAGGAGYGGSQGSGGSSGAGGSQGSGGAGFSDGHTSMNGPYQNSAYRQVLEPAIQENMMGLNSLRKLLPELFTYYTNTYTSLISNPQITVFDMLSFYSALHQAVTAQLISLYQANVPSGGTGAGGQSGIQSGIQTISPINVVTRVTGADGGGSGDGGSQIIVDGEPFSNPFISLDGQSSANLVNGFIHQTDGYLQGLIQADGNLTYLLNVLTVQSFMYGDTNRTHTDRVLTLLRNFNLLYERSQRFGFIILSPELNSNLRLFYENIGPRGTVRGINGLFDPNRLNFVANWERIYETSLEMFNERLRLAGLDTDYENHPEVGTVEVLEMNIVSLIDSLSYRMNANSAHYNEFVAVRNLYTENSQGPNSHNVDFLWHVFNLLKDLNATADVINMDNYNEMVSFDYADLIRQNIYNGIFIRPDNVENYPYLSDFLNEFSSQMALLNAVNSTLYNEISSRYFHRSEFDALSVLNATLYAEIMGYYNGQSEFDAWLAGIRRLNQADHLDDLNLISDLNIISALKSKYREISNNLSSYRDVDISERDLIFYQIRYLLGLRSELQDLYKTLSDSDKIMVNKYLYDQCLEMNKTFNGIQYQEGIVDFTEDLNRLRNIGDISDNHFEELLKIYAILASSGDTSNLFSRDLADLDAGQIADILIDGLPKFYQKNSLYASYSNHDLNAMRLFSDFVYFVHWGRTNAMDNLTRIYNLSAYYREQYDIFYQLEYCLYKSLPIDLDLYRNFTFYTLNRAIWSNDVPNKMIKTFAPMESGDFARQLVNGYMINAVNHLPTLATITEDLKIYEEYANTHMPTILFMLAFNQYIKMNITQMNVNVLDLLLVELGNFFTINQVSDLYSIITYDMPDENWVISMERDIASNREMSFSNIDVSAFSNRLELFRDASPVGYWLLMNYCRENFNYDLISLTQWKFNKNEYCIKNKQGKDVTYYDFCNLMLNEMKHIMNTLDLVDGNNITFRSANLTIGRLIDKENPYNNIFNKRRFFENWLKIANKEDLDGKLILDELAHDLGILETLNRNLYNGIMREYFPDARSASDLPDIYATSFPFALYDAYCAAYNKLSAYRNNSLVSDNEINAVINQLDNNTIGFLPQDYENSVRSYLLNYIYFWELYHDTVTHEASIRDYNVDPGRMSVDLLDKPLAEIYKRYLEITNLATYHVFDDDVDFNSLSTEEMRNVLINNLYRAYHAQGRFGVVFDILKGDGIEFDSFMGYEDYIYSIRGNRGLIYLYDLIRDGLHPSNDKPNDNSNLNPIDDGSTPDESTPDESTPDYYDPNHEGGTLPYQYLVEARQGFRDIIAEYNNNFLQAWRPFVIAYTPVANYLLVNLMDSNFMGYYGRYQANIVEIIDEYLSNMILNINPNHNDNPNPNPNPNQGSAVEVTISSQDFEKMKEIILNREDYPDTDVHHIYNLDNDRDVDECYFRGSWDKLVADYPLASKMVLNGLMGGDLDKFIQDNKGDYAKMRQLIVNYLKAKIGVVSVVNPGSNVDSGATVNPSQDSGNSLGFTSQDVIVFRDRFDGAVSFYGGIVPAWEVLTDRSPLIANYVLEHLMGGNVSNFLTYDHFYHDEETVTAIIVEYLNNMTRDILNPNPNSGSSSGSGSGSGTGSNNNINPNANDISLTAGEFSEIKKILEDDTIYPKKVHYVVSDDFLKLYGSWDLLEEKYPVVAQKVRTSLFKDDDLFKYAFFNGNPSGSYRNIRQNIIEFIRENIYHGEAVPDKFSEKIGGKEISQCTVDEIYTYVKKELLVSSLDDETIKKLSNDADTTFVAYVQYLDLMVGSGVSGDEYNKGIDQFKNSLLNILEKSRSNPTFDAIKAIFENKNLRLDLNEISSESFEYQCLLASWQKFESEFPVIAKYVLEKRFNDNINNLEISYELIGDDRTRQDLIAYIKDILFSGKVKVGQNSVASQNLISLNPEVSQSLEVGRFVIDPENVAGADVNKIMKFMDDAVKTANGFVGEIRRMDRPLAASLSSQIDSLYQDYLVHVVSSNHQWQYLKFINALNALFDNIDPAKYVDSSDKLKSFIIKKESNTHYSPQRCIDDMTKSLGIADDFVREVNKTNKVLAKRIYDKAHALYDDYVAKVKQGAYGEWYYSTFVNKLNGLFTDYIESSKVPVKMESEDISKMSNEQILGQIGDMVAQPLSFPKKIMDCYNELKKEKNPDRDDLIDLFNDVKSIGPSVLQSYIRFNALQGKYPFFDEKNFSKVSDVKNLTNMIKKELQSIYSALPNLYLSLNKTFDLSILDDSSVTLDDCNKLLKGLREFTADYLKFHSLDINWYNSLSSEFGRGHSFNSLKTYYDIKAVELGFTKDLSLAGSKTIKDYIRSEMAWLKDNNRNLYDYYLHEIFNDAASVDDYFEKYEFALTEDEMDSSYRSLYLLIQEYIKPSRDLLVKISPYLYDRSKGNIYIGSIEEAGSFKFTGKKSGFTIVLFNAIRNLNSYSLKLNLTDILLDFIMSSSEDGSITPGVKKQVKNKILKHLGIQHELDDNEFTFLADIMDMNLNHRLRSLLLSDYVKIINAYYNSQDKDYRDFSEYQRIRFEVLRYQALSYYHVTWFKEELDLLNNLESLRAYSALNGFLELKLITKNHHKNIAGIALDNSVRNSAEYAVLTNPSGADVAGLNHINLYYSVFNSPNHLPSDLEGMIGVMQSDLDRLHSNDYALFRLICDKFLKGNIKFSTYVANIGGTDEQILNTLTSKYKAIYRYLGAWRNNEVVDSIEHLLH